MARGFKTGGRTAGTPNKATLKKQKTLNHHANLEKVLDKLYRMSQGEHNFMDEKLAIHACKLLLQYHLPKPKGIETDKEEILPIPAPIIQVNNIPQFEELMELRMVVGAPSTPKDEKFYKEMVDSAYIYREVDDKVLAYRERMKKIEEWRKLLKVDENAETTEKVDESREE